MRENSKVRYFVNKIVEVAIWQHHNNHEHLQIEVLVRPGYRNCSGLECSGIRIGHAPYLTSVVTTQTRVELVGSQNRWKLPE